MNKKLTDLPVLAIVMSVQHSILKLKGKVQHYQWGGVTFLPELLGEKNETHKPYAEYWMGIHPLAPSTVEVDGREMLLSDVISQDPVRYLTAPVWEQFGGFPYLLKIMDVHDMLSIQVHPTRAAAISGFERENSLGIPLDAPNRNYKDTNHKPEVMLALSEFWLLHGFRSKEAIERVLEDVPEFNVLLPLFRKEGLYSLYRFLMEMDQSNVNNMLESLIKREIRHYHAGELQKSEPGWWVARLFEQKQVTGDLDRGIFSIYLLNLVKLQPGEAIFQAAGVPHAYLEGQNVELMSNSDNVLRGGLTPKYIDVVELLANTVFEPVEPVILTGDEMGRGERRFSFPIPDFGLMSLYLQAGQSYEATAQSPEIWFVLEGGLIINNDLVAKKGEAFLIFPYSDYTFQTSGNTRLCKAFVPVAEDYSQA